MERIHEVRLQAGQVVIEFSKEPNQTLGGVFQLAIAALELIRDDPGGRSDARAAAREGLAAIEQAVREARTRVMSSEGLLRHGKKVGRRVAPARRSDLPAGEDE